MNDLDSFQRSSIPRQTLHRVGGPGGARLEKIVIGSLDDPGVGVEAQYNPKDISIEQSQTWNAHPNKGNLPDLAFGGGAGRTMSLELFFDGFESGQSVQPAIDALVDLSRVRKLDSSQDSMLRPHVVAVVWGDLASMRGVIEQISTKLTMFLPSGAPVRATCQLKIREVAKIVDGR
jgi:contractile injection system tube protein